MYIKGFDENLCCRGMQYEIGKTYDISDKGKLQICSETALHFCDNLLDTIIFYSIDEHSRYCEVEPIGEIIFGTHKYACQKLRIVRELSRDEIIKLFSDEREKYELEYWKISTDISKSKASVFKYDNCNGAWRYKLTGSLDYVRQFIFGRPEIKLNKREIACTTDELLLSFYVPKQSLEEQNGNV